MPELPIKQRWKIHRAIMRGLPIPPDQAAAADATARHLRIMTWVGAGYLVVGLCWVARAIIGGTGTSEWLRWLSAAGFLTLSVCPLFAGYRARRMLRAGKRRL